MKNRFFLLVGMGFLSGCAGVKKAPMPDMKHLIPVNQSVPDELIGRIPPNVIQAVPSNAEQAVPVHVRHIHRRVKLSSTSAPASTPSVPASSTSANAKDAK